MEIAAISCGSIVVFDYFFQDADGLLLMADFTAQAFGVPAQFIDQKIGALSFVQHARQHHFDGRTVESSSEHALDEDDSVDALRFESPMSGAGAARGEQTLFFVITDRSGTYPTGLGKISDGQQILGLELNASVNF